MCTAQEMDFSVSLADEKRNTCGCLGQGHSVSDIRRQIRVTFILKIILYFHLHLRVNRDKIEIVLLYL